ncbi:50S ribosomal protein L28, chloroplastic-like [Zingiber officinale]|uniref:50S ribosomal protein L28, chloroplastic-like n=1 Tax=Zingiber officinale TaxID=94328 RepID=UPI001C4B7FA8|nr:50S ribosomal protein L28, chloroplastic-like [Zingiber officinale]
MGQALISYSSRSYPFIHQFHSFHSIVSSLLHSPLLGIPTPGQPQPMAAPSTALCIARAHRHSASKLRVSSGSFSPAATFSAGALGFGRSRLVGFPVIFTTSLPSLRVPHKLPIAPVVARRVCPFTGKKANRANKVSFSNHKTKKLQFVNLQYKRIWWEAGKRYVKLRLSTKALKTIEKNGLDAVAKKAGIDLRKE